jgi:hypothetical protein
MKTIDGKKALNTARIVVKVRDAIVRDEWGEVEKYVIEAQGNDIEPAPELLAAQKQVRLPF